ncbi:unnamed protein product [Penicillium olsonii]|nr:unnamed protein product [Penicillium olsonii]
MALNLHRKSSEKDEVLIYDTSSAVTAKFVSQADARVIIAEDLASISRNADVIITCLPNPAIVQKVYGTLLANQKEPRPDRLVIDCSTIDPLTSLKVAYDIEKAEFGNLVDAPMSGGVVGATAGSLSFMVGGSEETFGRAQQVLEKMGSKIVHCGPNGTGISAKLANNYILAINNLATAEAMNFGVKAGLDPSVLARIINSATGRNWASEVNNPVPGVIKTAPASRQYQGGFATALMNKDLGLAITAAEQANAPLFLSNSASNIYGKLTSDDRYAKLDFSAVYKYMQENQKAKL